MGKPQISLELMGLYFIQGQKKSPSGWEGSINSFLAFALRPMMSPIMRKNFLEEDPQEISIIGLPVAADLQS